MVFRPQPLQIGSLRTDYSGEGRAIQSLGDAIGAIPGQIKQAQQQALLGEIGKGVADGTLDAKQAAGRLIAAGKTDTAFDLLKLNEAQKLRQSGEEASRTLGSVLGGYYGDGTLAGLGKPAPAPSASTGPTGSALPAVLNSSESGGNWQAQNSAVGAGGAVGHFGRAQFGQARLQEAANAGAIPQGTTPEQFMRSPELQRAAENWHFADIDQNIKANGFDQLIGRSINGVPITLDGMRAVAHLGGNGGLQRFIQSGGQYNPSDANGTSLMDYLRLGAQSGTQSAAADTPAPGAANVSLDTGSDGFAVPGQPPMTGRTFDAITRGGQPADPAFMSEGVSQPWMGSALQRPMQPSLQRSVGAGGQADLPAPGAVPAIGQAPPPPQAAATRYPDIDPNSQDGGARAFQLPEAQRQAGAGQNMTSLRSDARMANGQTSAALASPAADLPAAGATPAEGPAPVASKDMPRPTNTTEAREYRETRAMENRQGKIGALASALSNPNLPTNAREIGQIFLKDALEQSKAPDSVKEFMYSRSMGWTQARSPAEYAAEKEKAKKPTASDSVDERKAAAGAAGLKPGDAGYQGFILTGKMPREDMGPLSATDKKAIMEADDKVLSAQTVIENLGKAKELSRGALSGPGSAAIGYGRSFLPDGWGGTAGQATVDLNNLVTTNALAQLKATFGGNPTEGERAILLEIQGSSNLPDAARQKIYDRAIALAQRHLAFNQQRAAELRGGDFYKSPEKRAQGANSPQSQRQPGEPVRVASPEEARKLPKGTPIILPDGRVGEVP